MKFFDAASPRKIHAWLLLAAGIVVSIQAAWGAGGLRPLNQYVHDHWRDRDGLPQNGVYSLIQGRDGYIWFGTQEGLVRFDGVRFEITDRTNTAEMKRTWVISLVEEPSGSLWVNYSTRGAGVGLYEAGKFKSITAKEGLRSNSVGVVVVARDSSIWFTHGKDGATRKHRGTFTTFGRAEGLPSDTVFSLADDSGGNIWFATPQGISRYNGTSFKLYSTLDGLPANRVLGINGGRSIFEDHRNNIWMSTDSGLVCFDGSGIKTYTTRDGLLNNRVLAVAEDRAGTLWFVTRAGINSLSNGVIASHVAPSPFAVINDGKVDHRGWIWLATNGGLIRFADGQFDHYGRADGLVTETVTTVLVDKEGSVWFGTDSDGLHRLREGKFVTYSTESGLKDPISTAVMEDSRGNLWFGSESGGVARLSGGIMTVFGEKEGFPRRVDGIFEMKDGAMMFCSREGFYIMRNGKATPFAIKSDQPFTDPRAFIPRRNGDIIVADGSAVYRLVDHRITRLFPQTIPGGISTVREDSTGRLWIGTFGSGLYSFGPDSLVHYTAANGFPANRVYGMYVGSDGRVWAPTEDSGVLLYSDGRFTQFTPDNGLFGYSVANIIEDNLGSMWFSGNKGVYRIKKQSLLDVASGKASSVTFDAYGTADGMKSQETNFLGTPNVWRTKDGRLIFPTIAGAAVVDPASIELNSVAPNVVIERLTADKVSHDLGSAISLAPGTGNVEIEYVGLSFIASDRVQYKYRLEGFDAEWVNPGNRTVAYYTNLRPGDYTFRVMAANVDGVWDTTGATLSFALLPHFYESRWFYALALVGFLFGGPSIYFWRIRQLKARESELARQVDLRTKELRGALDNLKETQNQLVLSEKMASLGQLTAGIAHEIKNPLNFITNFAVLSEDLTSDLRKELAAERDRVDPRRAAEITSLLNDLEQNVRKINEHGKRADGIVRGMLLHSRGKAGEKQETDVNALLAEYTNLAYHGMRAQDSSFNIKIETDLDPSVGKVSVVPQDLSRAFLNIVNNACYAANDRKKSAGNGFVPTVRVAARMLGDMVEIRVRDNGNGIPKSIIDKVFNPFFTTKPAGAGTGLGLSLSYDIITQEHRGTIRVETAEGEFTEFIIGIPRNPIPEGVTLA
jgi:signal transduction histidine kinase/ligand-binding sensor domain-containing protein